MKIFKYFIGVLFIFVLTACTRTDNFVHRHDADYSKNARTVHPIQTPPGVYGSRLHDDYPVPGAGHLSEDHPVSILPPQD